MFESLHTLVTMFTSNEAAHFSALLQALTAFGASVYGLNSFNKWLEQKYLEKCSDYAETALNFLDSAHETLMDLLQKRPSEEHWLEKFSKAKAEFGQARRKAQRLGDEKINSYLKSYEELLPEIENNFNKRYSDIFSGKEKADADEALSNTIPKIESLYKKLYAELLQKSLIRK